MADPHDAPSMPMTLDDGAYASSRMPDLPGEGLTPGMVYGDDSPEGKAAKDQADADAVALAKADAKDKVHGKSKGNAPTGDKPKKDATDDKPAKADSVDKKTPEEKAEPEAKDDAKPDDAPKPWHKVKQERDQHRANEKKATQRADVLEKSLTERNKQFDDMQNRVAELETAKAATDAQADDINLDLDEFDDMDSIKKALTKVRESDRRSSKRDMKTLEGKLGTLETQLAKQNKALEAEREQRKQDADAVEAEKDEAALAAIYERLDTEYGPQYRNSATKQMWDKLTAMGRDLDDNFPTSIEVELALEKSYAELSAADGSKKPTKRKQPSTTDVQVDTGTGGGPAPVTEEPMELKAAAEEMRLKGRFRRVS